MRTIKVFRAYDNKKGGWNIIAEGVKNSYFVLPPGSPQPQQGQELSISVTKEFVSQKTGKTYYECQLSGQPGHGPVNPGQNAGSLELTPIISDLQKLQREFGELNARITALEEKQKKLSFVEDEEEIPF